VAVFLRLAALTSAALVSVTCAFAAPFGPEEATELLAKTMGADQKCKVLNAAESDQLKSFVGQAEIALAEQSGLQNTKATLDRGKAAGQKVACDATTAKAVRGVMATAKDALASTSDLRSDESDDEEKITAKPITGQAAAKKAVTEDAAETPEDVIEDVSAEAADAKPKPKTDVKTAALAEKPVIEKRAAEKKVTKPVAEKIAAKPAGKKPLTKKIEADATVQTASVKKPITEKPITAKPGAEKVAAAKKSAKGPVLNAYAAMAEAYFVELKCRKMSPAGVQAFYSKVMANHRKAVAAHGGGAVSGTVRNAQARANSRSCG
jgi:hypothetical protein